MNEFNTKYLGIHNITAAEVADMLFSDMLNTIDLSDEGLDVIAKACTIKSVENMITFTECSGFHRSYQEEIVFLKEVIECIKDNY